MTARSGVEYDGTDPRAGMPCSSRTASSGGMPSVDRKLATIGFSDRSATSRSAGPNSFEPAMSGGRKTATTASTPSSSTASCRAARKSSGVPSVPMSTGSSSASSSPWSRTASATSTPMAVELPTIATRLPGRQRLVGQERADVEHLRHGLDPDHPGGGEQRGHRLLGHRDRGVDQAAPDLHVPAALHGDHRLGAADASAPAGRTSAGCRSSPGAGGRPRCRGRWPSTAAGRCR